MEIQSNLFTDSPPSNAPIDTSNCFLISLLVHMFPPLSYSWVLLECIIASYSWSSIDVCFLAHSIDLLKSSSEIDWQKSTMPNVRMENLSFCISRVNQSFRSLVFLHWLELHLDHIFLLILSNINLLLCHSWVNQSITSLEFFHWLKLHLDHIFILILSNTNLLTLPISVFVELIIRHFVLLSKCSLWSLIVMKAGLSIVGLCLSSVCSLSILTCIPLQCWLQYDVSIFCTFVLYFHSKVHQDFNSSFYAYCWFCR